MLVLKVTDNSKNIVHLIIGPQTHFQFDMIGFLYVSLSELISTFDNPALPCGLILTRCEDEFTTQTAVVASTTTTMNENGVIFCDTNYMELLSSIAGIYSNNVQKKPFFGTDDLGDDEDYYDEDEDDQNDEYQEITKNTPLTKEEIKQQIQNLEKEVVKETEKLQEKTKANPLVDIKATYKKGDPRGVYIANCKCALCRNVGVYVKKGIAVMCADCLKIEYGRGNIDTSDISVEEYKELDDWFNTQFSQPEE